VPLLELVFEPAELVRLATLHGLVIGLRHGLALAPERRSPH
jgi:hypothetical protein